MAELRKTCNNCRYKESYNDECENCFKYNEWKSYSIDTVKEPGGLKYDDGKIRVDLIPPEVILEIGKILTYGANKYGSDNWQKLENFDDRYYGALLRHLLAWRSGEENDKESGLSHLSHAMTNIMFLTWKQLQNKI